MLQFGTIVVLSHSVEMLYKRLVCRDLGISALIRRISPEKTSFIKKTFFFEGAMHVKVVVEMNKFEFVKTLYCLYMYIYIYIYIYVLFC